MSVWSKMSACESESDPLGRNPSSLPDTWRLGPTSYDQDHIDIVGRIVINDQDGKRGFSWRVEIVNSTLQNIRQTWGSNYRQLLCLNSGSASVGDRIWRPITSQCHVKAVPIRRLFQMQLINAAFFYLFLEDTSLLSFAASHIWNIFFVPQERKKERKKMATSWRRSSLLWAWAAEIMT